MKAKAATTVSIHNEIRWFLALIVAGTIVVLLVGPLSRWIGGWAIMVLTVLSPLLWLATKTALDQLDAWLRRKTRGATDENREE